MRFCNFFCHTPQALKCLIGLVGRAMIGNNLKFTHVPPSCCAFGHNPALVLLAALLLGALLALPVRQKICFSESNNKQQYNSSHRLWIIEEEMTLICFLDIILGAWREPKS